MTLELKKSLQNAIDSIEILEGKLVEARRSNRQMPYNEEIENLRMLMELIKEQVGYESTRHTAG